MDRLARIPRQPGGLNEQEIAVLESNEPKLRSTLAQERARSLKTEQPTKRRADDLVHRMLSVLEAADYLGVSTSFLNKSRITGDDPEFHKLGRRVVYAPFELDTWLDERKRRNTSESASVRGRR
jgi:hypothetical protein